MGLNEHTPGPWKEWHHADGAFVVFDGASIDDPGLVICARNALGHRAQESAANARLIAASPRMYEFILRRAEEGDRDAAEIIRSIGT